MSSLKDNYDEQLQAREKEKLNAMISGLSEADQEEVWKKGLELLSDQNNKEGADCLPTVLISGVYRNICWVMYVLIVLSTI